ncbi:hypothetical protein KKA14_11325 [bacterium]|nr:hypothetical protein [bacterium]
MKRISVVMAIIILPVSLWAGCWNLENKADLGFAELDEKITLSFKDAVNCSALTDAVVELDGKAYKTDLMGEMALPLAFVEKMDDRDLLMVIKKEGYIPLNTYFRIMAGSVWQKRFLLSPRIPIGQMRFVLQWGPNPLDLDLHLKGEDFHISYRDKKNSASMARLDQDAMRGYGPETITLERIEDGKTYQVFVHRYSPDGKLNNKAQVYVYKDNRLDKIINLPETEKSHVEILTITDHQLHYLNQPVDSVR